MNTTIEMTIEKAFTTGTGKEKFGKTRYARVKESKKLVEWLEKNLSNYCVEDSVEVLSKNNDGMAFDLLQAIRSFPNDKYHLVNRIDHWLQFLFSEYRISIRIPELENFKNKTRDERIMKMLKYLHSGSHTRAEIAEAFGISERTLSEDLSELFDGYEFLGTEMSISEMERGSNRYHSQIHPVFQALHMKEIYSMTIGLKLTGKGTVFEEDFNRIASQVYSQLSDYAKRIIHERAVELGMEMQAEKLKFKSTLAFQREQNSRITYYVKEPIKCSVTYHDSQETVTKVGLLKLLDMNHVILITDEEEIVLNEQAIQSIKRAYPYWTDDFL